MTMSLLLPMLLGAAEALVEPHTDATFQHKAAFSGMELVLTGADRRQVFFKDAYAVAHYADPALAAEAAGLAPEKRREHYIKTPGYKALVFHGVYSKVPARAIRWSWKEHFDAVDKPVHEAFVKAFEAPFRAGERLYFIASPDGMLEVRQNDDLLGQWEDPGLVETLWAMCLGPKTEVKEPTKLVAVEWSPDALARRDAPLSDSAERDQRQ